MLYFNFSKTLTIFHKWHFDFLNLRVLYHTKFHWKKVQGISHWKYQVNPIKNPRSYNHFEDGRTDRRTDRQTDGQTPTPAHGRTDGKTELYMLIIIIIIIVIITVIFVVLQLFKNFDCFSEVTLWLWISGCCIIHEPLQISFIKIVQIPKLYLFFKFPKISFNVLHLKSPIRQFRKMVPIFHFLP